jgi:hypothetical protein
MPIHVYVSPDATSPFGDSWELVGVLDGSEPIINQQTAKGLQRNAGGSESFRAEFYLSGEPASRWVIDGQRESFGIAFDLLGDRSRVLVANRPGRVAPLKSRPPEAHPGLVVPPIMIPIKISGGVTRI